MPKQEPEQWILDAAIEGQIMGPTNLSEVIERHYAPERANVEELVNAAIEALEWVGWQATSPERIDKCRKARERLHKALDKVEAETIIGVASGDDRYSIDCLK